MPKFKVGVEKMMRCSGFVLVDAKDAKTANKATELVNKQIAKGELQTTAAYWADPEYEDCSFCTTGDVDCLTGPQFALPVHHKTKGETMRTVNVPLPNGEKRKMWQDRLQKVYRDFAEFEDYCRIYSIAFRLGFKSSAAAWKKNPTIRGSVYPSDLAVVR